MEDTKNEMGIVSQAYAETSKPVLVSDGKSSTFSFPTTTSSKKSSKRNNCSQEQPSKRVLKKRKKQEEKQKAESDNVDGSSGPDSSDDEENQPSKNWKCNVVEGELLSNTSSLPAETSALLKNPNLKEKEENKPNNLNEKPLPRSPAFHAPVFRCEKIQISRMSLPIVGEEQVIMEYLSQNDVLIICGETGSGKTTQIPQFLYEAGYSHPNKYKGMIGITQPRRVAAVSMAKRVAFEMGLEKSGEVGYQVRYDSNINPNTRIKFMTDGILLRELTATSTNSTAPGQDLLLSKYSVLIIDEAHERTVGTDVLIGWLTRIQALRNSNKFSGVGKLKLIIMSATLRVQDFIENPRLFPETKPPVVKVDGRQHQVTVHYNRRTTEDYLVEAYKKVVKIHSKLPHGKCY